MSDHQETSEQAVGGLLGKAAGRAKEIVGSAETETARRELEQELAQMSDEERIEREQAQEKRQAKAAQAEEIREASALELEAGRAERVAGAVDSEPGR
jgi:hypothetical protein